MLQLPTGLGNQAAIVSASAATEAFDVSAAYDPYPVMLPSAVP